MSFGTLYTHNPTPRSTTILALAKRNGLDLKIIYAEKRNQEAYQELCKYNAVGQVPTFVGADGYVLSEFAFQSESTMTLLGATKADSLAILKWMSFANSDLFPAIGGVFLSLIKEQQIIKQDSEDSIRAMLHRGKYLDEHLKGSKYLVGERLTIADFFTASMLMGAYAAFRGGMIERFPVLSSWYDEVCAVEWYREVAGGVPDLGFPLPQAALC